MSDWRGCVRQEVHGEEACEGERGNEDQCARGGSDTDSGSRPEGPHHNRQAAQAHHNPRDIARSDGDMLAISPDDLPHLLQLFGGLLVVREQRLRPIPSTAKRRKPDFVQTSQNPKRASQLEDDDRRHQRLH
mmetsp:Transcript_64282/g.126465  ORF Transcript_64282/g.126465 Transcript_64282/m.126465 type:complete len:132 (+) Transcript_64282:166-561(+)